MNPLQRWRASLTALVAAGPTGGMPVDAGSAALTADEAVAAAPMPGRHSSPRSRLWAGIGTSGRRWIGMGREYFRHHGIWAPGVRLQRRLDFSAKAALVATAFIVPVLVLAWLQCNSAWRELERLDQARRLLTMSSVAVRLLDGAVDNPSKPAPGPRAADGSEGSLPERWRAFEAVVHPHLVEPVLSERFRALAEQASVVMAVAGAESAAQQLQRRDFTDRLLAFNETLLTDSPLAHLHSPGRQAQARLAQHLLLRIEHSLGRSWAVADEAIRQGDGTPYALDAWAKEHYPLASYLDRAQVAAAALAGTPADTVQPVTGAVSAQVLRVLDQARTREAALHRWMLAGARQPDLQGELAGVQAVQADLRRLQTELSAALASDVEQLWQQQRNGFAWVALLLLGILVVANYFLYSFFHVLRGGMRLIQHEVKYVAEGDLSRRPNPLGNDEAAQALRLINESLANLGGLFSVVRRGVASVAHASTEIASASADLSRGSADALTSVESVREGVGSMVGHLEGYEQCVQQAVERARAMRTESGRSRRVMGTLSDRIADLQQRSREIGKIVGMIDGIAFQTHLLSLNASVEAARAGEAGKGFAVVALEVRQLSTRVSNAAQQISDIVTASIAEIEQGRAIAHRSVEAVASTEAEVQGVNKVLQRLTELTCEGQANARQMATSLDELHQFSRAHTKLADQMSAASQELRRQSLQVSAQSARFKLA